jgi:multimeric flavodoxin WrbA
MKAIGIVGSPRPGGNTQILVEKVLEGIAKHGVKTELITLADKKISHCLGCISDEPYKNPCIIDDDMKALYPKLLQADIIVIGSPVYGCNVSSLTKAFLDRLVCLPKKLEGKIGGVVVVGEEYGIVSTEKALMEALNYQGLTLPGWCTAEGHAKKKGEILKDKEALKSAKRLGEILVKAGKNLNRQKFNYPNE